MTAHDTQQPEPLQRLTMNVPAAARLLGISRTLAFQLAARGELPGQLRLGKRIVVSRRALERALDGETTQEV